LLVQANQLVIWAANTQTSSWLAQQPRQLGDIRRDPPRLVARAKGESDATQREAAENLFGSAAPKRKLCETG